MPTPAEEALAEGFGELVESHSGSKLWYFGAASFAGILTNLRPDDPRIAGSADHLAELIVLTASMPAGVARGQFLKFDGQTYTVANKPSRDASTGFTKIIVACP